MTPAESLAFGSSKQAPGGRWALPSKLSSLPAVLGEIRWDFVHLLFYLCWSDTRAGLGGTISRIFLGILTPAIIIQTVICRGPKYCVFAHCSHRQFRLLPWTRSNLVKIEANFHECQWGFILVRPGLVLTLILSWGNCQWWSVLICNQPGALPCAMPTPSLVLDKNEALNTIRKESLIGSTSQMNSSRWVYNSLVWKSDFSKKPKFLKFSIKEISKVLKLKQNR